jgi:hypothetical protein
VVLSGIKMKLITYAKLAKGFVWLTIVILASWVTYEAWPEKQPLTVVTKGYYGLSGDIRVTPGLSVQFWSNGKLFATRDDKAVFVSEDIGMSWKKSADCVPPNDGFENLLRFRAGRLKIVRRLLQRCGPPLLLLQNETILVVADGVYRGRIGEGKIVRLEKTLHTGTGCLPQGLAEDREGIAYFGEYQTGNHKITRLYRSGDHGSSWNIRYEFPRTEIRHIHAVAYDPFRNLLWLATGDSDQESRILYSSDKGATFQVLGSGSQDWRAVSLQFTARAIFWGTDSPGQENQIFRWDWETGRKTKLLTVRNPFFYSTKDGMGNLFFSTAADQGGTKSGEDMFSEIWQRRPGTSPLRLLQWPKGDLKRHGTIMFAKGTPPQGWLAFTPINLEGHHCEAVVMKLPQ